MAAAQPATAMSTPAPPPGNVQALTTAGLRHVRRQVEALQRDVDALLSALDALEARGTVGPPVICPACGTTQGRTEDPDCGACGRPLPVEREG